MSSIFAQPAHVKSSDELLVAWESYKLGGDFYRAGEPRTRCLNAEQRRGYMDANRADAEAATPGYADGQGF